MMLFPKTTKPYYIATPSYEYRSSGVRSLHLLCHALNQVGQVASLAAIGDPFFVNHNLNTPVATAYGQYIDPIVIYPDIVKGNDLQAKRVVRYLMAERGKYGGDKVFPETDQVWGALPSIAEDVLRIPVSDTTIFYDKGLKRKGACFYSHKYDKICGNKLLPITNNAKRLEGSLEDLAYILNESEVCYIYEVTSAMTEAALCGCPVVLVRTPFFNTIDPTCMMGNVIWDDGEVVKECKDYWLEYMWGVKDFWENQLPNFIEKTQRIP
jgi:hypothetical protein